jgi:LCP family protein required for cell wall assembly
LLIARALQLTGYLLMIVGLTGFLLSRDIERAALSAQQLDLLGLEQDQFHASFLIAGRDTLYLAGQSEPVYDENGQIVCWNYTGERAPTGTNTDAIAFVHLRDGDLTLIMLPRDLLLDAGAVRINHLYREEGADGLRRRVSDLLGIPVDYHAIIDLEIFERLVDAVGGVPVNVPTPMRRTDCAAELSIDLRPGPQILNGREAAYFVRYRDLPRGDIDRLDNIKLLAYGLLERVKRLDLWGVRSLPEVLDALFDQVETNASPALLGRILPHVGTLRLRQALTLPVEEVVVGGAAGVATDPAEVEKFLASVFGGTARRFTETPAANLLITNGSGQESIGEWYRGRLLRMGVPEERIALREGGEDPGPTRLAATLETWDEGGYYADLVHASRQQVDRLPDWQGEPVGMELILAADALRR